MNIWMWSSYLVGIGNLFPVVITILKKIIVDFNYSMGYY